MRYGYFDDAAREYVIDRVNVTVSFTNYLGTKSTGCIELRIFCNFVG